MKCPNCGYVSYLKVDRCLRCGSQPERLTDAATRPPVVEDRSPSLPSRYKFDSSLRSPADPETSIPADPEDALEDLTQGQDPQQGTSRLEPREDSGEAIAALDSVDLLPGPEAGAQGEQQQNPWRYELSERLERLRQRRGRTRNSFDPSTSLDLAFNHGPEKSSATAADVSFQNAGNQEQSVAGGPKRTPKDFYEPFVPKLNWDQDWNEAEHTRSEGSQTSQWSLGLGSESLDDSVDTIASHERAELSRETEVPAIFESATLSRRFMAGAVDLLVLLAAACLFALVFWIVGGHISLSSSNLAILGLIAVVGVVGYFASFVGCTSSTPGMALMQLEVRNLEGGPPTISDSILRAMGYLVSASALMLGFVWAAVDSERLTWHDRMSGTCVTWRPKD